MYTGSDDEAPGFIPPFGLYNWSERQENFVRFHYRDSGRHQVRMYFDANAYDLSDPALRLRLEWTADAPFVPYDQSAGGDPTEPDEPGGTYKTWTLGEFGSYKSVYLEDLDYGVGEFTFTLGRMDGEDFVPIAGRPVRDIVRIAVVTP